MATVGKICWWPGNGIPSCIEEHGGLKLEIQDLPEMESMHGIWYSITAGDFDQDGDQDYLAGQPGEQSPL